MTDPTSVLLRCVQVVPSAGLMRGDCVTVDPENPSRFIRWRPESIHGRKTRDVFGAFRIGSLVARAPRNQPLEQAPTPDELAAALTGEQTRRSEVHYRVKRWCEEKPELRPGDVLVPNPRLPGESGALLIQRPDFFASSTIQTLCGNGTLTAFYAEPVQATPKAKPAPRRAAQRPRKHARAARK